MVLERNTPVKHHTVPPAEPQTFHSTLNHKLSTLNPKSGDVRHLARCQGVALLPICDGSFTCGDNNTYRAHPWSLFLLRRARPGPCDHRARETSSWQTCVRQAGPHGGPRGRVRLEISLNDTHLPSGDVRYFAGRQGVGGVVPQRHPVREGAGYPTPQTPNPKP